MTREEIESSLLFKMLKKYLKGYYPWVKDVKLDDDNDIERWNSICFVNLIIDVNKLKEMYNLDDYPYEFSFRRDFMGLKNFAYRPTIETTELLQNVSKEVKDKVDNFMNITSIPNDVKMIIPNDRGGYKKFSLLSYIEG